MTGGCVDKYMLNTIMSAIFLSWMLSPFLSVWFQSMELVCWDSSLLEKHSSTLKRLLATYPRKDVGDRGDTFIIDSVNYLIIYEKELPQ